VRRFRVDDQLVRDLGVGKLRADDGDLLGSDDRVLAARTIPATYFSRGDRI